MRELNLNETAIFVGIYGVVASIYREDNGHYTVEIGSDHLVTLEDLAAAEEYVAGLKFVGITD